MNLMTMTDIRSAIIYTGLLLALMGCQSNDSHRMATSSKSASYLEIGKELSALLEIEPGATIEVVSNEAMGSDINVEMLSKKEVDFALAQGDTKLAAQGTENDQGRGNYHIKTVLPLYPEILFIIYPDSLGAKSLKELVKGRKVGMGPEHGGTASFMERLLQHYGIPKESYTAVYTSYEENVISEEIEISCALTGYNNHRIENMLRQKDLRIFSLGDANLANKGSSVDGFCLTHRPARPFIIPRYTYTSKPSNPVLTVAVDATLLAHRDVDKYLVYNIVEAIFDNKQYLASRNLLLSGITESFDAGDLNYPLHEGARMFMERNKPSFVERHGKLLGSILLALVTAIPMAYRWHKQRQKDSIDEFYRQILELENKVEEATTLKQLHQYELELRKLRESAFESLINERLDATPAFRILTDLLKEVRGVIEYKRHELQADKR